MPIERRAWIATILIPLLLAAVGCSSESGPDGLPQPFLDRAASGEEVFTAYSDAVIAKDADLLELLIGDQFLIQRTDGSWADRAGFIDALPDLRRFEMTDVEERRGDDIIVVRFQAAAELAIDGEEYPMTAAPMLVVFEWSEGQWWLQAQANFNSPSN